MGYLKLPGGFGTGLLVGLGAATLVPLVARIFAGAGKPLLKEAIKGGVLVMEKGKSLYAETLTSISEVSTEVKEESSTPKTSTSATKSTESATKST